eukprot:12175101-Ditylum_brightwellii.AAC.1
MYTNGLWDVPIPTTKHSPSYSFTNVKHEAMNIIIRKDQTKTDYVDTISTHRPIVFKSITSKVYLEHATVPIDARVAPSEFPTISELQE